jgi:hypothetical protein
VLPSSLTGRHQQHLPIGAAREEGSTIMATKKQADPTENKDMGAAGHETGIDEPSEMGTAGIYATPVHDEAEDAEKAGREQSNSPTR